MRKFFSCRCLSALTLVAASAAHAGPPNALYYFVDERGVVTWSNLRTDARLRLSPTPDYSGVLAYTIGAPPSPQDRATGAPAFVSTTGAGGDTPPADESPQDH